MNEENLLGRRLRRVRKMRGLGQKQLADQAHISSQTVGYCERGEGYSLIQRNYNDLIESYNLPLLKIRWVSNIEFEFMDK